MLTDTSVRIDRPLLLAAVDALDRAQTPQGHLAQRVTWEHRGSCPPGFCAAACVQHRALVAALRGALEPS